MSILISVLRARATTGRGRYYRGAAGWKRGRSMKVFLSWSGEVSKAVALELREWLRDVIQTIEPWMSSEDIRKGSRWSPALAKELAESRAGIFCLTPDNLGEPWLNFEAGAVSNTAWTAYVCTYLFGVTSSDITGPLTQFQSTAAASKQDNLKLLATINSAQQEGALEQKRLDKAFNTYWPALEQKLSQISKAKLTETPKRPVEDMVEETLNIVRALQKQSASPRQYEQLLRLADSSPLAHYAPGQIETLGGIMGVGIQGANAFIPGGSSDDLTGYTRVPSGKQYEPGPQGPLPTIRPRKPETPKNK